MNSSKKQKVSTLLVTNDEVQLNTNIIDEERVSGNLKIKKLNHDCLAQVLMHLSVLDRLEMEKVCQKWKEATQMSSYKFKKINFNDLKITLDKEERTWKIILEKYGRYLKDLTISHEYLWIGNVIWKECRNITRFDIDFSFFDEHGAYDSNEAYEVLYGRQYHINMLIEAVRTMSKLKYLKLKISTHHCRNFFTALSDLLPDDMEEIHLVEYKMYDVDEKPTINISRDKFTSLRCLTLQRFRLNQTVTELLLLNANTLVHLDLSNCDSSPEASVLSRLHNLEYLDLYQMGNINVNVITTIAHNCQKLKHFEYGNKAGYYDDDDDEFEEMKIVPHNIFRELKHLKNLEYLNIRRVETFNNDDNLIICIADNCKKLKHFYIECRNDFSSTSIKEITKFKNLESFNFNCDEIDSELLIEIANNCLELKSLNERLTNITKAALNKLINLTKLEVLDIYKCESLTGDLLIDIVDNCKNLIDLNLSGCHNVTEASLLQVGKLQNLKRLNIDSIKNVPNAMFDNFNQLEYLSCFDCPSVTDEGIMKVLDNCKNLNHLYLLKSGISVQTVLHAFRRKCIFKILRIQVCHTIRNDFYRAVDGEPYFLRWE